jgi:hypothetical protein
MFLILAAAKARLTWKPNRATGPRYVRKARAAHTPYGRRDDRSAGHAGRHRASLTRPSYSHPASRARGAAYAVLRRPRPLPTGPGARRTSAAPARRAPAAHRAPARDAVPPRSTVRRTADQAAIIHRWARQTIRERAATGVGTVRRHCANPRYKSRDAMHLPYIGLCWDTAEMPHITIGNPA